MEFDSIEQALDEIFAKWQHRNIKVRFLFVERDPIDPQALLWNGDFLQARFRHPEQKDFIDQNELMALRPLDDAALENIVTSFAANMEQPDNVDAELTLSTLRQIDPNYRRPLFAQYIADAQICNGVEAVRSWDINDAHNYVYNKELERIKQNCSDKNSCLNPDEKRWLNAATLDLLLIATLAGGVDWADITKLGGIFTDDYARLLVYTQKRQMEDP